MNNKKIIDTIGEVVDARKGVDGTPYEDLKTRIDTENANLQDKVAELDKSIYIELGDYLVNELTDTVTGTPYHLTRINKVLKDGSRMKWEIRLPTGGIGYLQETSIASYLAGSSIAVNGGLWDVNTNQPLGRTIIDGEVIHDNVNNYLYPLGIKDDGTLTHFQPNQTAQEILASGCNNCITAFIPIIVDGQPVDDTYRANYPRWGERHPRQILAETSSMYILLTSGGRVRNEVGLSMDDCIRLLNPYKPTFAYNLDGGGSATTVIRGNMINPPVDEYGSKQRQVWTTLHLNRIPKEDQTMKDLDLRGNNKESQEAKALAYKLKDDPNFWRGFLRLISPTGSTHNGIESWDGTTKNAKLLLNQLMMSYYAYLYDEEGELAETRQVFSVDKDGVINCSGKELMKLYSKPLAPVTGNIDTVTESGEYWCLATIEGSKPYTTNTSFLLKHIQLSDKDAMQIAYPYSAPTGTEKIMIRRKDSNGEWFAWSER